jgi:phosphate-selective porin OprO and OprP
LLARIGASTAPFGARLKFFLPCLALLAGLSCPLYATDYYVSPFGDDSSGDGTEASPWRSLSRAMTVAVNTDRILVSAGTYDSFSGEAFPIQVADGVSIIGPAPGAGTATLNGKNVFVPILVVLDNVEPTLIQNLRIDGDVIEVFGNPVDLQVLGCIFLGGQRALSHESSGDSAGLTFIGNTILGMSLDGLVWFANGGAGLAHDIIIQNNGFFGETDSTDGVHIKVDGEVTVNADISGNTFTNFRTGIRATVTANGSSTNFHGAISNNESSKNDKDGIVCRLSALGIGPSVASFDATLRNNSVQKNGQHGIRIELSGLGPDNHSEFLSPLYANTVRRNKASGIFISDSELGGGTCDTRPDLGGGAAGSWGGNTLERNDDDYSSGVQFDLRLEGNDPVFAQSNWWGDILEPLTADALIEQHIFHQVDDPLSGLVDFSLRRPWLLNFSPTPKRADTVSGKTITLFAASNSAFVAGAGSVPISVTVGDTLSTSVVVAENGRSLTFQMPYLRNSGGGTLPVEVLNPGGQGGLSSIVVEGDGKGGGFCFVATATYNDPDAAEVRVLRRWRDECLSDSSLGRSFIRAYYRNSPPLAAWIAVHPMARSVSRLLLQPVVWAVQIWLHASWIYGLLALCLGRRLLRRLRQKGKLALRLPPALLLALCLLGLNSQTTAQQATAAADPQDPALPAPPILPSDQSAPEPPEEFDAFRIYSPDRRFYLAIGGKLENDWSFYSADSDVENTVGDFANGTEFRRARFALSGKYDDWLKFKASFDFQDDGAGFRDLYGLVNDVPVVGSLKIGHFKEPFSLESLTSSTNMVFMERSLLTSMSPGRNIGAMIQDTAFDRRATWAFGVFRETDSNALGIDQGDGQEFAVTARTTWLPYRRHKGRQLVHLGAAASLRNPDDDQVRYRSRPESHLSPYFINTGKFSTGSELLWNLEAAWVHGPGTLQAEYTQARLSTNAGQPSLNFSSAYIQGAWILTGEHRTYKRSRGIFANVPPEQPFLSEGGGLGAWEAALRYSVADLTDQGIGGGKGRVLSAALNWHLTQNVRISLDYGVADLVTFGNVHFLQLRFHLDW